jgi:hydrogenase maturation protein HypF
MFTIKNVPSQLKPSCDVLALGADTRPMVSWSKKGRIFSCTTVREIVDSVDFYKKTLHYLAKKFSLNPEIITFDPHPLFSCRKIAVLLKKDFYPKARLVPVFHHVAHVANFGIEIGKNKKFIGIAFDGTGFGQDRRVWGGEFFIYEDKHFRRRAHFDYQRLPGNEAAIREPWRVAVAILYRIYSQKIIGMNLKFLKHLSKEDINLVCQMCAHQFNTPETSSVGRLFDAVAALCDMKIKVSKEAEAAIACEKAASLFNGTLKPYPFKILSQDGIFVVDVLPLFKKIVADLRRKESISKIAYRFHVTLAQSILAVCLKLKKDSGISCVYLSGGVFMNKILSRETEKLLCANKFQVIFANKNITTDAGISLGQIAACCMESLCA